MANCGATGTALDRAARSIADSKDGNLFASLLGHATAPLQEQPLSAPEFLPPPLVVQQAQQRTAPLQQHSSLHIHHPVHHHYPMSRSGIQMMSQQQQQQQQQQQHAFMMMRQQQESAALLHHQIQQQRSMAMMIQQQKGSEQYQQQQPHGEENVLGHEGRAKPASMEELSEAWKEATQDWEALANSFVEAEDEYIQQYDAGDLSSPETYEFQNRANEPVERRNWMEEGMRQFEAGNLKEAIRAFEYELQQTDANNATAWRMLGKCHAENDMDRDAILCLEQAVDRDPYNEEARLALGVSYVNELQHERALEHLKAWITHNVQFAGLTVDDDDIYGTAASSSRTGAAAAAFDEVQRLLLRALEFQNKDAAHVQADIYEALGVIYNVSRDYDAAADAFRKACELRPRDYQLWNKLGATLANGNHSEQALPAYHTALQIKPKYARAWLNMAISHSNLEQYDEAARCYLQTLCLNPSATHCWSYLRIALSCSERWDLIPLVANQDVVAFREHFDFVVYNDDAIDLSATISS